MLGNRTKIKHKCSINTPKHGNSKHQPINRLWILRGNGYHVIPLILFYTIIVLIIKKDSQKGKNRTLLFF